MGYGPTRLATANLRHKRYDLTVGEGLRIWEECLARARSQQTNPAHRQPVLVREDSPRYGTPQLIAPRLGQGIFRVAVMDAYGRACAVTQEHSLPALEASHIQPYAKDGPHEVRNGVLLRADLHRLFDQGYVTITPEHRIEVSSRLKEDYQKRAIVLPAAWSFCVCSHVGGRCAQRGLPAVAQRTRLSQARSQNSHPLSIR